MKGAAVFVIRQCAVAEYAIMKKYSLHAGYANLDCALLTLQQKTDRFGIGCRARVRTDENEIASRLRYEKS